jgi:aminomethyltransferase
VVSDTTTSLRRTPLYDAHVAAGAKLVDFAGWEMPIQYRGIREEHRAVRNDVGVFDVSHMGQVETAGRQALERLQRLTSNDVSKIAEGGAQYSLLCNDFGGVLDDLFTYRLSDKRFLTVTNASNHEKDLTWMQLRGVEFDADVRDRQEDFAMLAVQGPNARALVEQLSDGQLPPRFHTCPRTVAGVPLLVCGTGYTGEDGVELLVAPDDAAGVWDAVVAAGRRAPSPSGGAPATRCASRPVSTSTAMISARPGIRSAPGSAGPARRKPVSSAQTWWPPCEPAALNASSFLS